jgi:hypothetical protein
MFVSQVLDQGGTETCLRLTCDSAIARKKTHPRARPDTANHQVMEMIPLLKHRRFDPELVDSMSAAYSRALGLSTQSDRATETVAPKIIELVTRGARSPTAIHLLAMEELRNGQ